MSSKLNRKRKGVESDKEPVTKRARSDDDKLSDSLTLEDTESTPKVTEDELDAKTMACFLGHNPVLTAAEFEFYCTELGLICPKFSCLLCSRGFEFSETTICVAPWAACVTVGAALEDLDELYKSLFMHGSCVAPGFEIGDETYSDFMSRYRVMTHRWSPNMVPVLCADGNSIFSFSLGETTFAAPDEPMVAGPDSTRAAAFALLYGGRILLMPTIKAFIDAVLPECHRLMSLRDDEFLSQISDEHDFVCNSAYSRDFWLAYHSLLTGCQPFECYANIHLGIVESKARDITPILECGRHCLSQQFGMNPYGSDIMRWISALAAFAKSHHDYVRTPVPGELRRFRVALSLFVKKTTRFLADLPNENK